MNLLKTAYKKILQKKKNKQNDKMIEFKEGYFHC